LIVRDTFYVKLDDVYKGGFFDGASGVMILSSCPVDSVWQGGPFDGFSGMFYSSCVPISFNGGFYDGESMGIVMANCPGALWFGGFYDGESMGIVMANCPQDAVWFGGPYDGESMGIVMANCPQDAVWFGGPYDGESMGIVIANCPQDAVWFGGPYDGSSFEKFLAQCTTNVFKGGFYDGFSAAMDHCGTPLPVEYLYLRAYWQGKDGVLNWATATETNNYGFIVEKLVNNQFTQVGFVPGAGNSNDFHEYFWIDYNLYYSAENNFIYRIKQIDIDGNYKTSNIVILTKENYFYTNSEKFQILRIYPNPSISNHPIYLLISSLEKLNVNLEIVTLQGEVLYKFMKQINEGLSTIKLENITLQPSTYLLIVKYENEKYVFPFVIVE